MKVTREDVENVALLSRLSIKDEDMDKNISELNDFLEYVDRLQQVDTENVALLHTYCLYKMYFVKM